MIIPNIWENKTCSKPPTSFWLPRLPWEPMINLIFSHVPGIPSVPSACSPCAIGPWDWTSLEPTGWATPLKNMTINWDDYSQYMGKSRKINWCFKPPTSQLLRWFTIHNLGVTSCGIWKWLVNVQTKKKNMSIKENNGNYDLPLTERGKIGFLINTWDWTKETMRSELFGEKGLAINDWDWNANRWETS